MEEFNTRFTHALLVITVMLLCEVLDKVDPSLLFQWDVHYFLLLAGAAAFGLLPTIRRLFRKSSSPTS